MSLLEIQDSGQCWLVSQSIGRLLPPDEMSKQNVPSVPHEILSLHEESESRSRTASQEAIKEAIVWKWSRIYTSTGISEWIRRERGSESSMESSMEYMLSGFS